MWLSLVDITWAEEMIKKSSGSLKCSQKSYMVRYFDLSNELKKFYYNVTIMTISHDTIIIQVEIISTKHMIINVIVECKKLKVTTDSFYSSPTMARIC
jgi:hypothetical protein